MICSRSAQIALKRSPSAPWWACILITLLAVIALSCGGTNHPAVATHNAYVTLPSAGAVRLLRINDSTGAITADAQTPPVAGTSPKGIALHPSRKFLYVVNSAANSISQFNIASDGTLTGTGTATPTGSAPGSAVIDPSGQFLLVSNNLSSNVSVFSIDSGSGALTSVGPAVYANSSPAAIVITPSGKFIFVANTTGDVTAFTFSAGVLTQVPGSPFPADNGTTALAVDANEQFLYTVNTTANNISGFTIDPSTGVLTKMQGSPYTSAAGSGPSAIAIDPANTVVYVATPGSSFSIWAFTITPATGVLQPVSGSPFNLLTGGGLFLVMEPNGSYFYVAGQSNSNIAGYKYNSGSGGGAPSAITNSPFATGSTPGQMVIVH